MALEAMYTPQVLSSIRSLLQQAEVTGEKVAAWDNIVQALRDAKLAWTSQVPPDFVGVHPKNRCSLGVGGSEAHLHGAQILACGWSWRKASDATAVEAPPPGMNDEALKANEDWVRLSGGLIPPLTTLKLLSLGGAHTNTFLRAVKAGSRSYVASLADSSGNLNADSLCAGRPEFAEAVHRGLRWTVLHWQVPVAFPGIEHLCQSALNVQAKGDVSEVEVMLDISRMRDAALARGEEVNWGDLAAAAGRSLPSCASWVDVLASFVQGCPPELLEELSDFHKAFGCGEKTSQRILGSEFLQKLSVLSWGPAEKFPLLKVAAIEANLSAPAARIVDGHCRLLTAGSLAALVPAKIRDKVRLAEKSLMDARRLCEAMKVERATKVKMVGRLDVRVICHLTGKSKESEGKQWADVAAIMEVPTKCF